MTIFVVVCAGISMVSFHWASAPVGAVPLTVSTWNGTSCRWNEWMRLVALVIVHTSMAPSVVMISLVAIAAIDVPATPLMYMVLPLLDSAMVRVALGLAVLSAVNVLSALGRLSAALVAVLVTVTIDVVPLPPRAPPAV